jgi:eukaryotic-like serine/threonine-protein kinase
MKNQCPQCDAELPPGDEWKQKLCPACLMKLGLSGAIASDALPEFEQSEPKPESQGVAASTRPPRRSLHVSWKWVGLLAGVGAVFILAVIAMRHLTERPEPPAVVRMRIDAANDGDLVDFAVSPDGHSLAYTVATERDTRLFVRRLDQLDGRELPGTEEASMPFWSPDSQSIGFFANSRLKTVRLNGGPPMSVASVANPSGGTWSAEGGILFASRSAGLQRVSSTGGEVTQVAHERPEFGGYFWPAFLPDGASFLFSSRAPQEINIGRLDSGETKRLIQGASGGVYANGRILFVRDGFLMAQPFDPQRGEVTDHPISIPYAERIGAGFEHARPYSAGGNLLAYRTGGASVQQELIWMDRIGKFVGPATEPAEQNGFSLSPDMSAVAIARRSEGLDASELWVTDLLRGTSTRLTFDEQGAANPLWSPDGRRLAFTSHAQDQTEVRWVSTKESRAPELLLKLKVDVILDSWSPDGRFLAYTASENGRLGLWILTLDGDRKATSLVQGKFNYKQARFSPDGRAVGYVSDESGRDEVYVRSFPAGDMRLLVSTGGGTQPRWRKDGRELFYIATGQELTSVQIESSLQSVGIPVALSRLPRGATAYEVANDAQRFLFSVPAQERERPPVHLVLNWADEK